jgi:hypothetical protein
LQLDVSIINSNRVWAIGLTLLAFVLQTALALLLESKLGPGKEVASDLPEYRIYVENPWVLLTPADAETKLYGGRVAAPFQPLLLTIIYQPLSKLGVSEFLAFRGTMIFWNTLGFGLAVWEIFRRWGGPRSKRDIVIALALAVQPLVWLPSAVLAQDDNVAAMWCGVCFFCWSRWGVWGSWGAAAIGIFVAKPFFFIYFAALWMAYPQQRTKLFFASAATFAALIGFMYLRDGQLYLLGHVVASYMSGSLYSLAWLLDGNFTQEASGAHAVWAKKIATWPTMIGLACYALLALRARFTLPSAIIGLYCVMFTTLVGMMPEYELWYWSWVMLLIWIAAEVVIGYWRGCCICTVFWVMPTKFSIPVTIKVFALWNSSRRRFGMIGILALICGQ